MNYSHWMQTELCGRLSKLTTKLLKEWKKVRVNATDALGETVSELFRVVVEDVNDAPVVSGLGSSRAYSFRKGKFSKVDLPGI